MFFTNANIIRGANNVSCLIIPKRFVPDGVATQDQALIEKLLSFYTNGNGSVSEPACNQRQGPPCPQNCGPPKVKIFGGDGIGAIANAIISPNSNSIIGFDIVDPGRGFLSPPYVELVDECGKGNGAAARAIIGPLDGRNEILV